MYCKPERQIVFVQKNLCSYKDLARVSESRVAGLGRAGLAELCDAGWWEEGRKGRPRCSLPAGDTGQSTGGGSAGHYSRPTP